MSKHASFGACRQAAAAVHTLMTHARTRALCLSQGAFREAAAAGRTLMGRSGSFGEEWNEACNRAASACGLHDLILADILPGTTWPVLSTHARTRTHKLRDSGVRTHERTHARTNARAHTHK